MTSDALEVKLLREREKQLDEIALAMRQIKEQFVNDFESRYSLRQAQSSILLDADKMDTK